MIMVAFNFAELGCKSKLGSLRDKWRNRHPASLLSVVAVVWLGVFAVPCTVFASAAAVEAGAEIEKSHDDCHGSHPSAATASDECCCDVLGISAGEISKTEKPSAVITISVAQAGPQSLFAPGNVETLHGPPPNEFSLPVYLSTRRLRI